MKHTIILILYFCFFTFDINAQFSNNSNVDISEYPSVEFELNNKNPDLLNVSDFELFELINNKEEKIDSFSVILINDTNNYQDLNKCVLIMIEALYHDDRYEQINSFFEAIDNVIEDVVNSGDKIKIVSFSLRNQNTKILKDITSTFTDDLDQIKSELDDFKVNYDEFSNKKVSDIMGALVEGVDLLESQDNKLHKSILLLSEERKNSYATLTANEVTQMAFKKNIVINTVKYNRVHYHQFLEPTLSMNTYGVKKVLSPSSGKKSLGNPDKIEEAKEAIINILENVLRRSKGNNYLFSVKLDNDNIDGNNNTIVLKQLDSKHQINVLFSSPGNWLYSQFQKNFILALGVISLISLLFIYIIYLVIEKRRKRILNSQILLEKQNKIDEDQHSQILKQKQELSNIKSNEENRLKIEKEKQEKALIDKNEIVLIAQMKMLGSFPILKYSDAKQSAQFEINKPVVSVGRDAKTNFICIPNSNISRNHFSIVFENDGYKIKDNNSTNGIIVNGYKIKEAILKKSDIIEIGDITFTFYI
tara:strand:- start:13071 stop:14669 length:1599 start_codon:yes stop_codon:yes gene_type:complete